MRHAHCPSIYLGEIMVTLSKREKMIVWAAASRKARHGMRSTLSVIELDASGKVISAHHHWI
jgi:hypothetical protein